MKDLVNRQGLANTYLLASAATSREEIGNTMHQGTKATLREKGIPFTEHRAIQICKEDYTTYDLLLGMDTNNLNNMQRILGADPQGKIHRLLDFTSSPQNIADPWYTDDFEATYEDVQKGCLALLSHLTKTGQK